MRAWAFLLAVLLAGCRPDKIGGAAGDIVFGADRVQFPMTVVGYSSLSSVEVRNTGRFTRTVKLTTKPPFTLRTATWELPGGSSVRAEITFAPEVPGSIELPLGLESEEQTAAAMLVGPSQLPPACDETGPCWHEVYDHASGDCVQVNTADGEACNGGAACFLASSCEDGACVGTPKVCDDGDQCTTNACDPNTGCVFFSKLARCGASSDPCKAPACDPAIGCTFTDVEDGVECGPSDCTTAHICLVGSCKQVAVNDGAACGDPSPCQARGLCLGQTCQRPDAGELVPSWTVWAAPGAGVIWDSIADRLGNVYWREAGPGGARLVSVTSAGFARYSVPITITSGQMALIEDLLVLHVGATLEARGIGDGKVKWTRVFALETGVVFNEIRATARGNPGVMYVGYVKFDKDNSFLGSNIHALDLSNGQTKWEVKLPSQAIDYQSFPVDEGGYLYFGAAGADGVRRYHSLTPLGVKRWALTNPHASPAAVFGGHAYHWDHWLSDTQTGAWVNQTPPTLFTAGYPRLALGAISFVGTKYEEVGNCVDGGMGSGPIMTLARVDPATSQLQWQRDIAAPGIGSPSITNTVLTSRNTVLFSQAPDYCGKEPHVLREIGAQGAPSFACQLPGAEAYEGEGLLNDKRWVARIRDLRPDAGVRQGVRAIALPGYELPAHGWATAEGSPGRDNHAR